MKPQQKKILIPSDWDGEDWECITIHWPKSEHWLSILLGFIVSPAFGRVWDETSGRVVDAQVVGREIEERNVPLVTCGGEEVPVTEYVYRVISSMGAYEQEETLMSLCGYNPKAFKIESGQLWVRDFCGEFVSIGELTDTKDEPITTNVYEGRPEEPSEWSKCGKAAGMIDALARMLQNGWDSKDDELGFRASVEAAVPSAKMGISEMWVFQADILAAAYLLSDDDVVDPTMIAKMKCRAKAGMQDTATWSEAEVDYVKSAIAYEITEKFDPVTELVVFALWEQAWQVLGPKDTGATIAIGASNFDADCECPEEPVEVGPITFAGTWTVVEDHGTVSPVSLLDGGRRVQCQYNWNAGTLNPLSSLRLDITPSPSSNLDSITIRAYPAPGAPWFPTKEWYVGPELPPSYDWSDLNVKWGTAAQYTRYDYPGYVDHIFQGVDVLQLFEVPSGRGPEVMNDPYTTTIILEIIEINGVNYAPIGP